MAKYVISMAAILDVPWNEDERRGKLNPIIFGLFHPYESHRNNKINLGNRNGQNDIPHQTNIILPLIKTW